ncbi:MAG: ABC transporter permease [Lachnospiraceae bacterium]|nr:ABC transporter permease [Lachnospiraceae bacterium]
MNRKKTGTLFTPAVIVSSIILVIVLVVSIFGTWMAPYDPDAIDLTNTFGGMTKEHWFGTDMMGRDQLSRMLCGAHTTILNAILVVLFADVIGIPIGLLCGYYGRTLDSIVMRVWDILASFPPLILAMVFVAIFGKGEMNAVIATGIVYIPMISRLTRSTVLTEKTKTYVETAKSLGYNDAKIIFHHIFPNCIPTLMAEFTLDIGYAIIALASLSYMGLGVQAPKSDWGSILQSGMELLFKAPSVALIPGIAIVVTVVALNMFADGIQMYIDPAQRKLPKIQKVLKKEGRRYAGEHG